MLAGFKFPLPQLLNYKKKKEEEEEEEEEEGIYPFIPDEMGEYLGIMYYYWIGHKRFHKNHNSYGKGCCFDILED